MEPLTLEARLERGETDETLCRLYGAEHLEAAQERCKQVFAGFRKAFGSEPSALFSAPGRTELEIGRAHV